MNGASGERRIVFRCDANEMIGGGHVMRCLTLANALAEDGAKVTFVAAAMPEPLGQRIADAGHAIERIPASSEVRRAGRRWEEPPLGDDAQLGDAKATAAAVGAADWVVVDHYLLDARWHSAARGFAHQILVIDDLANRTYDSDILLDQTFGRESKDYRELVPSGARILAGATYALLRPEFARERPAALDRRQAEGAVRRVLVSIGTADPGGITERIVEQVLGAVPDCAIDVVLGAQAGSLGKVRDLAASNPRIAVHVDSDGMAGLMRDADVAIGAAGTTSWERCCLGLPSICLVRSDNQRLTAVNLERAGAVVLADSLDAVRSLLEGLVSDQRQRLAMSAAAAAITDGKGVERACEALTGPTGRAAGPLRLRPARSDDSRMVWLWRNDYTTRMFSQTTAPITWPDHEAWWQESLASAERQLLIAEVAGAPVAALRFDRLGDTEFEVSINLAPFARNSGLGGQILEEACGTFLERHGPARLTATIHRDNPASRHIFERRGFVRSGGLSNPAFERYVLDAGSAE